MLSRTLHALLAALLGLLAVGSSPVRESPPQGSLAARASGTVVYVSAANTAGPWDGTAWTTAYRAVEEALEKARSGDEIWVAAGTYKPTATGDRSLSFRLKRGVALYGGFAGTETTRHQRDWAKHVTVLSGDIGTQGDPGDNSYHVVVGADDAVLDGFTVTGGHGERRRDPGGGRPGPPAGIGRPLGGDQGPAGARPPRGGPRPGSGPPGPPRAAGRQTHITPQIVMSGPSEGHGGGMINYQCAPTVRNCVFSHNSAGKGGAMYNMATRVFGPPRGPGDPAPTVIHCTFLGNRSFGRGGAVANDLRTHPTFIGCTFIDNATGGKGGAIYNDFGCSPTLTHCLFVGNSAFQGGAIGNDGGSSPVITCCTFTRNRAQDLGAALYQGSGPANNPVVTHCILWGDVCEAGPAEFFNWHHCRPEVTASCVQGGCAGEGNVDADPKFIDPGKGDYRPAPDSPCPAAGYTAEAPKGVERPAQPPRNPPQPRAEQPPSKLPAQTVVYVSAGERAPHDGRTWATAYASLQQGIDHAWACGGDVWVARGTYEPTPAADRSASFRLRPGVAVYGGFAGTETRRDERNAQANATVLSGDIGKPGDAADNCYHVLVGADKATLDGFTVTGGNADGQAADGKGGGMVNYLGERERGPFGPVTGLSPRVVNCTFRDNRAVEGGAAYNFDRCAPAFDRCTFVGNAADNGGAVVDRVGARTTIADCTFRRNRATWRGGAHYIDYGSRPTVSGCAFLENTTDGHGGAVYALTRASQLEHSAPTFTDCAFTANRARLRGGAVAGADDCLLQVTRCAFTGNHAGKGGGALSNDYRTHATLTACTFSANSADEGEADVDSDETSRAESR